MCLRYYIQFPYFPLTQLAIRISVTLMHVGQCDQFKYCNTLLSLVIMNIAYYPQYNEKCYINERVKRDYA